MPTDISFSTQSMEQLAKITCINGDTILYEIEGPVTIGQLLWATEEHDKIIASIKENHATWAAIILFRKSSILSADSHGATVGEVQRMQEKGQIPYCASFVIAPDVDGYGVMESIYAEMHVPLGNVYKAHETLDEAIAWTQNQLSTARTQSHHI